VVPGVDAGAAREDHAAKNRVTHAATIGGTASVNVPHRLFGISLVLSANSPAQVTLLYPSQILFSDYGGIEIDSTGTGGVPLALAMMSLRIAMNVAVT
jgi:hypothetical protein